MPLQLLPPGEGLLTQLAEELEPGGRDTNQVFSSLVEPQLSKGGRHLTAVLAGKLALPVDPLDVGSQGGLGESLVPALVQVLAQTTQHLPLHVKLEVIPEHLAAVPHHLPTLPTPVQVEVAEVDGQNVLLYVLVSSLVVAKLTLVLPAGVLVVEILPGDPQTLLSTNINILGQQVIVILRVQLYSARSEWFPLPTIGASAS